jgi:hypothetical protein
MKRNNILIALCALFSISSLLSIPQKNESLTKILSFINEKSGQASPVFDLLAKPRLEQVNTTLDRILQKAIDDQALNDSTSDESTDKDDTIINARQHQNTLQELFQSNPSLFLSDAEALKPDQKEQALPAMKEERHNERQMLEDDTNSSYSSPASDDFYASDPYKSPESSEPSEWGELNEGDNDTPYNYDEYYSE